MLKSKRMKPALDWNQHLLTSLYLAPSAKFWNFFSEILPWLHPRSASLWLACSLKNPHTSLALWTIRARLCLGKYCLLLKTRYDIVFSLIKVKLDRGVSATIVLQPEPYRSGVYFNLTCSCFHYCSFNTCVFPFECKTQKRLKSASCNWMVTLTNLLKLM